MWKSLNSLSRSHAAKTNNNFKTEYSEYVKDWPYSKVYRSNNWTVFLHLAWRPRCLMGFRSPLYLNLLWKLWIVINWHKSKLSEFANNFDCFAIIGIWFICMLIVDQFDFNTIASCSRWMLRHASLSDRTHQFRFEHNS